MARHTTSAAAAKIALSWAGRVATGADRAPHRLVGDRPARRSPWRRPRRRRRTCGSGRSPAPSRREPMPAMRVHSCLASAASVATTASVVLSGATTGGFAQWARTSLAARRADAGELAGDAAARARAARRVRRSNTLPLELSATSAATVMPFGEHDARRADAALQALGVRAGAGTDAALATTLVVRGGRGRAPTELGVGPVAEAAADAEVEQHGGRHDRHDVVGLGPDREPAAALGQPPHHASRRRRARRRCRPTGRWRRRGRRG